MTAHAAESDIGSAATYPCITFLVIWSGILYIFLSIYTPKFVDVEYICSIIN